MVFHAQSTIAVISGRRETDRQRQIDRDRQTRREKQRETRRETERETETERDRQTETEIETETDRHRDRERHREREVNRQIVNWEECYTDLQQHPPEADICRVRGNTHYGHSRCLFCSGQRPEGEGGGRSKGRKSQRQKDQELSWSPRLFPTITCNRHHHYQQLCH